MSAGVEIGPHNLFRGCIAGSHPRHDPASFIRGKCISHNFFILLLGLGFITYL